ncbi:hypothetical protein KP509_1Z101800 [Ceratopteris richardii]|nr:hypothetical protein KP509_1Z101800 [Ceratopteris richardii]
MSRSRFTSSLPLALLQQIMAVPVAMAMIDAMGSDKVIGPLLLDDIKEVISYCMKAVSQHSSSSHVVPFHCDLAPSYGKLKMDGAMLNMEEELKVIIAGTTRSMKELVQGKGIEWSDIVATMSQNPLLEPHEEPIERRDHIIKSGKSSFKFDGSPDETIVREVKAWFGRLINDGNVLNDTKIDIDVLARIVAVSGARITDFLTLLYKQTSHESKVLDIGVLRYPDHDHPFFKVYRCHIMDVYSLG